MNSNLLTIYIWSINKEKRVHNITNELFLMLICVRAVQRFKESIHLFHGYSLLKLWQAFQVRSCLIEDFV